MKRNNWIALLVLLPFATLAAEPDAVESARETNRPLVEFVAPSKGIAYDDGLGEFTVAVRYSRQLDPASFRAEIGGVDVSRFFNPQPGHTEVVALTTTEGQHALNITAQPRQDENKRTMNAATTFRHDVVINRVQPALEVRQEDSAQLDARTREMLEAKAQKNAERDKAKNAK